MRFMGKGFATENSNNKKTEGTIATKNPKGRLISWSPWPTADFQTRYPAFPFVLTIIIIVVLQWYISLMR